MSPSSTLTQTSTSTDQGTEPSSIGIPHSKDGSLAQTSPDSVQLTPEQEAALTALIRSYQDENRAARLEEVRRVQLNREFYRGNQNIFWNSDARRWQKVTSNGLQTKSESDLNKQRYDYVTNIYASQVDTTVAFLSAAVPKLRFVPESARVQDDVLTAKAASKVAKYIEDNNKIEQLRVQQIYYLCTDGGACSYVRYVQDGQQFGYDAIPIMGEGVGQTAPPTMGCPTCGQSTPIGNDWVQTGQFPTECPGCKTPLSPANVQPAQSGIVPQVIGYDQKPRGQEVISIYGCLEVQRPYYARKQGEMPWWSLEVEVPKSKLRVVFPDKADEIGQSDIADVDGSAQIIARYARISLAATAHGRWVGGGHTQSLVTFRRVWLHNWAFFDIDDQDKARELYEIFPDGAYVAIAGETVCEARNENPDKSWAFTHAKPGEGQIREGIAHSMVDVQRRYNIEENIMTETFEYGIPTRVLDNRMINREAYRQLGSMPGAHIDVQVPPGMKGSDAISDTPPAQVSPQVTNHMQWLFGETSQMMMGNFPSLFGGDTEQNKTATGITIARDQAAGRMATFIIHLRDFWARTMMNAIDCFRKNRKEDVELAVLGDDAEWRADMIHLDDLRGNIYARAEADEAIPRSWSDRRSAAQQLIQNPNPALAGILLQPDNIDILENVLGVDELVLPGELARTRQLKQISDMLANPLAGPIPVDPILDDNEMMLNTTREWANSSEGQIAMTQNPQGFAVIREQAMQRQMMMMPPPMAAPPAGGEQPHGAPPPQGG